MHHEKSQTKQPVPEAMATSLSMLSIEVEEAKGESDVAFSESSSAVMVEANSGTQAEENARHEKSVEGAKTPENKSSSEKQPASEKVDDDDGGEKGDKDGGKVDRTYDDTPRPGPAHVISSPIMGSNEAVHGGFNCDEYKVCAGIT